MAFIEIRRRCDDCEATRAALKELTREVDAIRLDYHSLYEKARTTLAKLAKREERANTAQKSDGEDPAQTALELGRQMILRKRFGR